MVRISVEVKSGRHLKHPFGDMYLELNVANYPRNQDQKTRAHSNFGEDVNFNETFEFDAEGGDNFEIRYKDSRIHSDDDYIGHTTLPLNVILNGGHFQPWNLIGKGNTCTGQLELYVRRI